MGVRGNVRLAGRCLACQAGKASLWGWRGAWFAAGGGGARLRARRRRVCEFPVHVGQTQERLGEALDFAGTEAFAEILFHNVFIELVVAQTVHIASRSPLRLDPRGSVRSRGGL